MLEYRDLKNSKKIIFDEMHRLIDEIANLSRLLAENPNNFEIQRQLLIANVDYILVSQYFCRHALKKLIIVYIKTIR